ncbi:MAG: dethiobiotin synthase [Acidovorax sp.]|jgi:dethiobiotin synthetase
MTTGYFVIGTEPGAGKTLIASGLLHALAPHHPRVVGMKPVATGLVPWGDDWGCEDALSLRAASTVAVSAALDNPVLLPEALPAQIAAARAGVHIDVAALVQSYRALAAQADAVVVEGPGGLLEPLNDTHTAADLALALALPVVLVVGLRAGCTSHALLTAEAIRARGLHLAGWVANQPMADTEAADAMTACLRERLHAPLLAEVPHLELPEPRQLVFALPGAWR